LQIDTETPFEDQPVSASGSNQPIAIPFARMGPD
jgi:hypothetical protein